MNAAGLPLALVGFMGAGKSRVGAAVARRLGVPFVDTDAVIVERAGPIEDLFAQRGETSFRALERDVVLSVLAAAVRRPSVLALGGGAVLSADVRRVLRELPAVVWLTAPLDVLFTRAAGGGRPLARDRSLFARLLSERESLYAEVAAVRVDNGGDRPLEAVVDEIVRACGEPALRPEEAAS